MFLEGLFKKKPHLSGEAIELVYMHAISMLSDMATMFNNLYI